MDRIFGTVIRELREDAGLSQELAAATTGVAQSSLSQLEDGKSWPRRKTVLRICDGLGVPIEDFFLRVADQIQKTPSSAWEMADWPYERER
ncbi:MAG: helix-turn-helix transcriptional regulator [Synergistaceae bacterium]|nr:helix-turn-helix transcriptional regulator [Synergistaceae bacterium]